MAEKVFEVGERVDVDGHEDVLIISLSCPICCGEGKTEAVPTPSTQAWLPVLEPLKKAAERQPAFLNLIDEKGRAKLVCAAHGRELRGAGIWTKMFHLVLVRARQRREERQQDSIATRLGGAKVAEIRAAVVEIELPPTENPRGRKGKGRKRDEKGREGSPRNPPHDRSRENRQAKGEIQEALTASEETS